MKVSINWIKDFVDMTGVDVENLISKFTMGVAEVEGVEYLGKNISNVVTAKILSVENVTNSKKLHLLKVDAGSEILQIVCGAPNVRVGLVTALAKIGAKLGDITITKASLAGFESFGMCCGGDEIGISEDHGGIVELDDDTEVGVDIKSVLEIEDIVFEVDNKSLTNRPDLWGHYGIAREIATLLGRPLKPISLLNRNEFDNLPKVDVKVSSESCHRYTSAKMENILQKKANINMQIRLFYCGMRSINLLADLTNYVMLELGQPMHAFDGNIVKKIEVYDLAKDCNFKTLDGVERQLKKGNMVIATNGEVVALAGVMGGENSEITENTTSVLIESANFDSYKVRTTATSLGMRTEASARYEKSLDPEVTMQALLRFAFLVKNRDKNAKISSSICDIYTKKYPKLEVEISKNYIDSFIGKEISEKTILEILNGLEFKLIENRSGKYKFEVPSFRATKDINGKADLVEEITRIFGYDNINPKSISQIVKPVLLENEIKLEYDTKFVLANRFNLNETHSYLWYDLASNKNLSLDPKSVIRCVNSINKDNDKIRSTMVPSLLKVINDNKTFYDSFGTFEIGRVVKNMTKDNLADETKSLCVLLFDKIGESEKQLFKTKEILDYLFSYIFKMEYSLQRETHEIAYYHPKNYYKIYTNNVLVGEIFAIHPENADKVEENCTVAGFEINFSALSNLEQKKTEFAKISKYPTTKLDFNFIIPQDKLYKDILNYAKSVQTKLSFTVSLQDIYENSNGTKSYTLHFEVNSLDKTLTTEDIEKFHTAVIEKFKENKIELKF
ncbi:MAG: phenylalanine--tRNA ligase subunit beta [Clostridia bacterium]|nr:phenylalanine--tRNA ligase subunit beta [Clostridia bacterium]